MSSTNLRMNTAASSPLGPYNVAGGITVSGLSSGAYMAVQMHVSFSSIINGSAIFAGGPFYCAEGNLAYAENKCMATTLGLPQVAGLVALTNNDATLNYIDSPLNLKNDRVYIFSGKADTVVSPDVVKSLQSYYQAFIPPNQVVADYDVDAQHCIPTVNYGESCAQLSSPYIGNCQFDGAQKALTTLFGPLTAGADVASNLFSFDQTKFFSGSDTSIGDTGYIYVPTSCQKGAKCKLHVSFHGCEQNIEIIGNAYAVHSGYNAWAENNDIIVLYPYVKPSQANPLNPNGCWDWWGYTGAILYGVQQGVQMQFARKLIKAVSGI